MEPKEHVKGCYPKEDSGLRIGFKYNKFQGSLRHFSLPLSTPFYQDKGKISESRGGRRDDSEVCVAGRGGKEGR